MPLYFLAGIAEMPRPARNDVYVAHFFFPDFLRLPVVDRKKSVLERKFHADDAFSVAICLSRPRKEGFQLLGVVKIIIKIPARIEEFFKHVSFV